MIIFLTEKKCSFYLDIKSEQGENYIIITLCQNYGEHGTQIHVILNIYKDNARYKTYTIAMPEVQQMFYLTLKPGSYMGVFQTASIQQELPACIRVIYSHEL